MSPSTAIIIALVLALTLAHHAFLSAAAAGGGPRVIIVGAGMSGISAGKRLSEAGITDLLILEATDHVGGRMHKQNFGGINVEVGANWVEGMNGGKMNPIWPIANSTLKLRSFRSNFDYLAQNVYKENGGLYDEDFVQKRIERADNVEEGGAKLSGTLNSSGRDDMSIPAMQRLNDHQPNGPATPVDMVVDYFKFDYEFAEPPRVTSLQNTVPLATFSDFGDDVYFVADQRGYESVVYHLAGQYLKTDKSGNIVDPRLQLNKVVREIAYTSNGVTVKTEDNSLYKADYVMVSASLGVLQSDLIQFKPQLPTWKVVAIYQFDMAVYTKIFVKFPKKFWPEGKGREFFLYASSRRGYYGVWQVHQIATLDSALCEAVNEITNGLAPVGRVYFTGEHTSEHYNGYVHGAYLSGKLLTRNSCRTPNTQQCALDGERDTQDTPPKDLSTEERRTREGPRQGEASMACPRVGKAT
ncbi:hypothetical protein ACP70R_016625 [Stipagrostis hirtigluma subsp. patula]